MFRFDIFYNLLVFELALANCVKSRIWQELDYSDRIGTGTRVLVWINQNCIEFKKNHVQFNQNQSDIINNEARFKRNQIHDFKI